MAQVIFSHPVDTSSSIQYLILETPLALVELLSNHISFIRTPLTTFHGTQLIHWSSMVERRLMGSKTPNGNRYYLPIVSCGTEGRVEVSNRAGLTSKEKQEVTSIQFRLHALTNRVPKAVFPEASWRLTPSRVLPLLECAQTNMWDCKIPCQSPGLAQIVMVVPDQSWILSGVISIDGHEVSRFQDTVELSQLDKCYMGMPVTGATALTVTFENYLKSTPSESTSLRPSKTVSLSFKMNGKLLPSNPTLLFWGVSC